MIKAVFFDMDNTLLKTQELYEDAHGMLADLVARLAPVAAEQTIATARRIETALFSRFGYAAAGLNQAFEDTLRELVPAAAPADVSEARALADTVYQRAAELKPGAVETIAQLAPQARLFLVTAGEEWVQQCRLSTVPFANAFEKIYIVPEKDAKLYREILAEAGLKPDEAVMIGDSLRSDILPALEVGMSAIYISSINWAGREMTGFAMPEHGVTAPDLLSAAAQITGWIKKDQAGLTADAAKATSHPQNSAGAAAPATPWPLRKPTYKR